MLEFALAAHRDGFQLQAECRFASDWTVIFGPSGAGKSTLLRLLAGLELPDRGHIELDGRSLTDTVRRVHAKPGRRSTSLVSQQPALFPHMRADANVGYGIRTLDRTARDQRIAELLELVDAAPLADRRPHQISGGEAQRVALARALAPLPRLLLLDEPFAALDGSATDALLARLQPWLRAQKMQTILVTHDAADAFASGAEVALMREGRVVAVGPASIALEGERNRILSRLASS
ncbi:MAG TPA: ATP-binding cassette domain-containing protein [Terracidiphilus sp.]|nr:ATP-binding cassette domain-containing protein [Terracidiphilus sp.]